VNQLPLSFDASPALVAPEPSYAATGAPLPLAAYDRPGDDLDAPLSPTERATLAHHGLAATPRPDGRYDVAGDRWPRAAWELRQELDLFYFVARRAGERHPLDGVL
jgi:hypothetical protein